MSKNVAGTPLRAKLIAREFQVTFQNQNHIIVGFGALLVPISN